MDLICRLCCCIYYDISEVENLFDDKNNHLLDKLNLLAFLTCSIDANDGFPPYICKSCKNLMEASYQFKMICESAEANFWALTHSNITDIKEEEMDVKYGVESADDEEDCTFDIVELDADLNGTQTTIKKDDNDVEFNKLCTDDSGEENTILDQTVVMRVIEKSQPTCDICGETFSRKRELQHHTKIAHRPTIWICESCGRKFHSQYALKHHINGTHVDTVEMNFSCDQCDFKCRLARYLVSHRLKHTGVQPHKCKECGRAFRAQGSLNRHVKAVHRNERPHKCKICDRCFKSTAQLREHGNFHVDQPRKCPECPKAYRYKNGLRRHISQSHRSVKNKLPQSRSVDEEEKEVSDD